MNDEMRDIDILTHELIQLLQDKDHTRRLILESLVNQPEQLLMSRLLNLIERRQLAILGMDAADSATEKPKQSASVSRTFHSKKNGDTAASVSI